MLIVLSKPIFWFSLILSCLVFVIFQLPDNRLHLVFCNVGQGDASLITYGSTQILIDGGPNSSVENCLSKHMQFWDRKLEMVVLTHAEEDHLSGLISVFNQYQVKTLLSTGMGKDSAVFKSFQKSVLENPPRILIPQKDDQIKVGTLSFKVLWPESNNRILGDSFPPELNTTALVLELFYGQNKALFTGDIPKKIETQLDLEDIDLLKVAHHGSKFSTSVDFLLKTKPEVAVISVGKNSYGHPTQEVLDRLNTIGAKILRTDQDGDIELVSDGKKWEILK